MHKTIRDTYRQIKRRNAIVSGALGKLDNWMPEPLKREFHSVCRRLFDIHSAEDIHTWMAATDDFHAESAAAIKTGKPYRGGFVSVPLEVTRDIEALRYIRDIESLGQENGIEAYLGKGAVKVYRGTAISTHATKSGRCGGRTNTKDGSRSPRPPTKYLKKLGAIVEKQMRADRRYSMTDLKKKVSELLEKAYVAACDGDRFVVEYPFKDKFGVPRRCPSSTLSDYFTNYKPADFTDD